MSVARHFLLLLLSFSFIVPLSAQSPYQTSGGDDFPVRVGAESVFTDVDEVAEISDSATRRQHLVSYAPRLVSPDFSDRVYGSVGLEAGIFGIGGRSMGYSYLNPKVYYQFNERFTMGIGFGLSRQYGGSPVISMPSPRSLEPRKRRELISTHIDAIYQPNSRLTFAASVKYMDGMWSPLWSSTGEPLSTRALGIDALLNYRFSSGNSLSIYVMYLRSEGVSPFVTPYGFSSPYVMDTYLYGSLYGPHHYPFGYNPIW